MEKLTKKQVVEYDKQFNQHPWLTGNIEPLAVERAEGVYYYDYDGNKYYDMSCQLSCSNIGYGHKEIADAIKISSIFCLITRPPMPPRRNRCLPNASSSSRPTTWRRCFLPAAAPTRTRPR